MSAYAGQQAPLVRDLPYGIALRRGEIANAIAVDKFGRNPDIDTTSAPEALWAPGGLYTGQPTGTNETVEVISDNAADTAAGTGARTAGIWGLKTATDTVESFEILTLAGLAGSAPTADTWYRIYRTEVLTFGSGGTAAGTLTFRYTTTTATIFSVLPIAANINRSTIAAYTVPLGSTLYIQKIWLSLVRASGAAGSGNIHLKRRIFGGGYVALRNFDLDTGGPLGRDYTDAPVVINAQEDIVFVVNDVSDNNTIANAEITGVQKSD